MLVLTRKKDQKIIIHDDKGLHIEVTVTDIRGKKAVLGFEAPKEISVDREEIFELKQKGKT